MTRWKQENVTKGAEYMRRWLDTDKGIAYKQRHAEYLKEWRRRNNDKRILIQKRSYNIIRLECLRHYSGLEHPACACCGEDMLAFLHLDHINGDGAAFRKQWEQQHKRIAGGTGLYYWLKKEGWPDIGLQVLCANCNLGKRAGLYCPHELQRGYDLNDNKIPEEAYIVFPELSHRRRGEAKKEAEELGVNQGALRYRRWRENHPRPKAERPIPTHCKNGHAYDDGNLYEWHALDGHLHRQCRQCKRDYKTRARQRQPAILAA